MNFIGYMNAFRIIYGVHVLFVYNNYGKLTDGKTESYIAIV